MTEELAVESKKDTHRVVIEFDMKAIDAREVNAKVIPLLTGLPPAQVRIKRLRKGSG